MSKTFNGRLLAGEHVLWEGRPRGGLLTTARDGFLIPFSFFWSGFSIFWESQAIKSGNPFMMIWGTPFVAIGLYMVVGRFFHDAWLRKRIVYALTDQRALIQCSDGLTVLDLATLSHSELQTVRDGYGTIRLGRAEASGRNTVLVPALDPVPQFFQIQDAGRVFDMLQKAQAARRAA